MKIYVTKIEPLKKDIEEVLPILKPSRREKVKRNLVEEKKLQSLYAGLLIKYAYEQENPSLPWSEVEVGVDELGKPFFKNVDNLYYSLSHSKKYCMVVFDNHPIGADIQYNQDIEADIVERFFPKSEIELFEDCLDEKKRKKLFYELWGMKEACSKLNGDGIPKGLARYTFLNDTIAFDNTCKKIMNIKYYRAINHYLCTVASNDIKEFPTYVNLVEASDLY